MNLQVKGSRIGGETVRQRFLVIQDPRMGDIGSEIWEVVVKPLHSLSNKSRLYIAENFL